MPNSTSPISPTALTDEGKLIEAGWIAMRIACIPDNASEIQLDEMRKAFFAGAQHLFASIMVVLDLGSEPTDKDMERMNRINDELSQFAEEFKLRYAPPAGRS